MRRYRIIVTAAFATAGSCGYSTHLYGSLQRKQRKSTFLIALLISVGVAGMATRQQVYTAAQVGSILDDEECVFSGSDDDFDTELDDELDPLGRGIVIL